MASRNPEAPIVNRIAAAIVLLSLGLIEVPRAQIYRARTDIVAIDVAVIDGRTPVTRLTAADFELRDNGVVQTILDQDRERLPLDVTVTLDVSGSMSDDRRAIVRRAVDEISRTLVDNDRGAVLTFSRGITERMPLGRPPLLADLPARGSGTSVLDALLLTLVTVPQPGRRQFAMLMTDGEDTSSYFDVATVADTAKYTSGPVSILLTRDGELNSRSMLGLLRQVAQTSGGELLQLGTHENLSRAFLMALQNFRTSYVLRYTPQGVSTTGWHDVSVRVKSSSKYSIRARRGYWGAGGS